MVLRAVAERRAASVEVTVVATLAATVVATVVTSVVTSVVTTVVPTLAPFDWYSRARATASALISPALTISSPRASK